MTSTTITIPLPNWGAEEMPCLEERQMTGRKRRIKTGVMSGTALCWLAIASIFTFSACSGSQPASNSNTAIPTEPNPPTPAAAPAPTVSDFDITAAWRPKHVVIYSRPIGMDPSRGMKYTVTPKAGVGYVALELTLKKDRRSEPASANVVLTDSSGGRYKLLFHFPSAQTKYRPNGDSISFDNDSGEVGQPLSKRGGKLIAVFEVPADKTGLKAEIDGSSPIDLEVKPR